ncbi:MAG: 16S rRNA (cytidine(1402)-2'-O)-methyltransferase [Rickettsiales bacterium]|jgi:16S rRNA (cytidine1402-2'-O)-methyltransferase|nr:16S rRNA (cytidine(1402)-2'-O)-methyltransferase [Rickettsiales bacterium]
MQELFSGVEGTTLENALYVVATPIGNMEDITLRMLRVLRSCDHIFCEDTRISYRLLKFCGLAPRNLGIYNDNSNEDQRTRIVDILKKGASVAIICDAGTPGISDPGFRLKQRCRENGLKIIPVPGPSACIAAVSASCIGSDRFFFRGFLPPSLEPRKQELEKLLARDESVVCYESPHRLLSTLEIIAELDGERMICVARELTKIFEDIRTEKASEMLKYYRTRFADGRVKGEIVLLLEKSTRPEKGLDLNDMDVILRISLKYLSLRDSARFLSEAFHLGRKEIYDRLLILGK